MAQNSKSDNARERGNALREREFSALRERENLRQKLRIYAVTDRTWLGARTLAECVNQAILGGATCVQLREKNLRGNAKFLAEAQKIREICAKSGTPFVVNDDVEIAKNLGADGVHIGQNDMNLAAARAILGNDKIIGVSVSTVEQAMAAERGGADYLGVGAIFPTGTKKDADAVSIETLRKICAAVSVPVVAIGGISAKNVAQLAGTGIAGIAVVSAIFAAENILAGTQSLARAFPRER